MKKMLILGAGMVLTALFLVGVRYDSIPPVIYTDTIQLQYENTLKVSEIHTSNDVKKIEILNFPEEFTIGKHKILIAATNNYHHISKKTVDLIIYDNTAPTITSEDYYQIEALENFNIIDHISIIDNVDGDLTNNASTSTYTTDTASTQTITITAKDNSGNIAKKDITLHIIDTQKPTIKGPKNITITEGEEINLKTGITAHDNLDGNLTGKIEIIGKVNTNKPGNYNITYSVKDNSGNITSTPVIVTVQKKIVAYSKIIANNNNNTPLKQSKNTHAYQPMTIYFGNTAVPYKNGGQKHGQQIIDSERIASTWGGAETFDANDGLNTHFIGHNPGPFAGIQKHKSFIITDAASKAYTYVVTSVYKVDDSGVGLKDGKDYFSRITGTSGGERVTFQACFNDSINWIVEAIRM